MRGRGERSQIEQLEGQIICLRVLARSLWKALQARTGFEAEALFGHGDELRAVNAVWDAVETVWEKHRVTIMPCRTILDPGGSQSHHCGWPTQGEMYFGLWPDGSTRNLTRAQVLMMGGQDPDETPAAPPEQEIPF